MQGADKVLSAPFFIARFGIFLFWTEQQQVFLTSKQLPGGMIYIG
jgi:hypothetical protein